MRLNPNAVVDGHISAELYRKAVEWPFTIESYGQVWWWYDRLARYSIRELPDRLMDDTSKEPSIALNELGKAGYETYGDFVGWVAHTGKPMPRWDELPEQIQLAWQAAAMRIRSYGQYSPDEV